jgi:hypothetical protein
VLRSFYHRVILKMITRIWAVGLLLILSFPRFSQAQQRGQPPAPSEQKPVIQQLSDLLSPFSVQVTATALVLEPVATRELRIRWTTGSVSPPQSAKPETPPAGAFSLVEERKYAEPPTLQRSLDLAAGRILLAAIDRNGRLKSWIVVADPRLIRAEEPGPGGTLTGRTLYLEETEFFVSLPDDPDIVDLRFYEPQPAGQTYTLAALGAVALNR